MKKPEPKRQEPAYDWHEISDYIKDKYKRDVRDWAGRWEDKGRNESKPYQDFWHWLADKYEPNRGGYFTIELPSSTEFEEPAKQADWVKEILGILDKEFPEANGLLRCWVDW